MTAIRVEHPKPPIDVPPNAATVPPEWKWDTLPVLKEVIEAEAEALQHEEPPQAVDAP
jgi:hypothetical protein